MKFALVLLFLMGAMAAVVQQDKVATIAQAKLKQFKINRQVASESAAIQPKRMKR